jgi:hypothetical protein
MTSKSREKPLFQPSVTLPLIKYTLKGPLDSSKPVPYPACPSCLSESDPPLEAIVVALPFSSEKDGGIDC